MAALWWHSSQRQLDNGQPIGSFNQFVANALSQHGFVNTRGNDQEAAGGKNGCWVSVGHFQIGGPRYWEIVMGSADNDQAAQSTVNEAVSVLQGIVNFD